MIDFSQIKGFSAGQRQCFEELVCQLARRESVPEGSAFRRIEGAGGDGGVESYWLLSDGSKIGYQAKFFTRAGDIDWRQIDESVEQALKTHPEMRKYVVAIPCDLTDRRGTKGKGKSGWELWSSHKEKWATLTTHAVEFVPWTASDLLDKLSRQESVGLRQYWFGTTDLSPKWLADRVRLAIADLDERYHPEDHVDVRIEGLFKFLTRDDGAVRQLGDSLSKVEQADFPESRLRTFGPDIDSSLVDKALSARSDLISIKQEFDAPCWEKWDVRRWKATADKAIDCLGKLDDCIREKGPKAAEGKDGKSAEETRYVLNEIDQLVGSIYVFKELLSGPYLTAEQNRAALIEGRAGSGKSHLLGRIAEAVSREGRPAILLLGQRFADRPIWSQVTTCLGLSDIGQDAFLQTLDAAAEPTGKRGIILVDAVNEGAGGRLWKAEIASFLEAIRKFPNLACVISCRSEYLPYVVPDGVLSKIDRFEIRGFETTEEQIRAAEVYMDRRGITRPSTPWLAPEFINPLFLRSACLALAREKKSEFPRGLSGTKAILAFYLRSVARNLGVGRDGTDELVQPTVATLREIAQRMATDKEDYISQRSAFDIAARNFSRFQPPEGQSWLDVLRRNGLIRLDPDPKERPDDPLGMPEDVVRFSFQRFQDHLMAEALLKDITDVSAEMKPGGSLAFIQDEGRLGCRWQGLIEALSIQVPERFGAELIDLLPVDPDEWPNSDQLGDAFSESIRWRDKKAFNDRTLEIFNSLANPDKNALLIELSASVEHPWNADFLHRNLLRFKLPQRDRLWSSGINQHSVKADDPVGRLIDWCLFGQTPSVKKPVQRLCGITLCWLFTSSNRYIRDRATKALVSLLVSRQGLFHEIIPLFLDVDDIYVLERLFAAAFGACCIDPTTDRLESYAASTYGSIFADGKPPLSILLRDYALGIIEFCDSKASLPSGIDINRCQPPYQSPAPELSISEDEAKDIAGRAGDEAILRSCNGVIGDFGIYEIAPRVDRFTTVRIDEPRPISTWEAFNRFESEVIGSDISRVEAFERLRSARIVPIAIRRLPEEDGSESIDEDEEYSASEIDSAESYLLGLLTPSEQERYREEAIPFLDNCGAEHRPPKIDPSKARLWVARRAYGLGWTREFFPNDSSSYYRHSRERPAIERIGKKYQWIALDELLCQLSDNYWMVGEYGNESKKYEGILDISFERDIDPTIIPTSTDEPCPYERPPWILAGDIDIGCCEEENLAAWPFLQDPCKALPDLTCRVDDAGGPWLVLYEHRSRTERYEKAGIYREHGSRRQEFRFVLSVLISREDRPAFVESLRAKGSIDVMDWDPPEHTDGPFLREEPWRNTWPQEQWRLDSYRAPRGIRFSFPLLEHRWESHLDTTLPDGAKCLIPSPWLSRALSLESDRDNFGIHRDKCGNIALIASLFGESGSSAVVSSRLLDEFLTAHNLQCIWLFVGERCSWPGGENKNAAWRRSEGICWYENGKPVFYRWNRDYANGASKSSLPNCGTQRKKSKKASTIS